MTKRTASPDAPAKRKAWTPPSKTEAEKLRPRGTDNPAQADWTKDVEQAERASAA